MQTADDRRKLQLDLPELLLFSSHVLVCGFGSIENPFQPLDDTETVDLPGDSTARTPTGAFAVRQKQKRPAQLDRLRYLTDSFRHTEFLGLLDIRIERGIVRTNPHQ